MNDVRLLLTFSHENFGELQKFWAEYAKSHGKRSMGTSRQEDERWGGKVQLPEPSLLLGVSGISFFSTRGSSISTASARVKWITVKG